MSPKFAAICCLGGLSFLLVAHADDDEKKKKKADEPLTEAEIVEQRIHDFPLPVGQSASGIRVPNLTAAGKVLSQFIIGAAQRKTEDKVEMQRVVMEKYDENGKPEYTMDLPASVLDLRTGKLTSDDPVTIKNPKFELTGEKMEFDTKTKQGRLVGKVHMVIFDLEGMAEGSKHE